MASGLFGGLIGMLLGSGAEKAPTTNTAAATAQVDDEEEKAKRARSALLEAGAGGQGQLQPGQVGNGDRIFGN